MRQSERAEFRSRLSDLEIVIGRAELSKRLGVKPNTLSRWITGKSAPRDRNKITTVNRIYGQKKKTIATDIDRITKERKRKKRRYAKQINQTLSNYIDDIYQWAEDNDGEMEPRSMTILETLDEQGYIAARYDNQTSDAVAFVIHGEKIKEVWGDRVRIFGVLEGYGSNSERFKIFKIRMGAAAFRIMVPNINNGSDIDDLHNAMKNVMYKVVKPKKGARANEGFPVRYLGYQFEEGDRK